MRRLIGLYREAYSGLPREVWLLAVASFVNRAGAMVLPFLTLYLTRERGYQPSEAGAMLAVFGVGAIFGIAAGGRLTDRIGFLPVQVCSLVLTAGTLFALGGAEARGAITFLVFVLGFAYDAFRPANSTAIAAFSPPEIRPRAFGLHRLSINLGWTIGPVLGGFLAQLDYVWLFVADGTTCVFAALFLAVFLRGRSGAAAPASGSAKKPRPRSPWRDGPFLAVLGLLAFQGLVFFQMLGALPLFLRNERGFDERMVGMTFAVNTVLIVVFEMVLTKRIERLPTLRLVGVAGLFVGLGYGLLPWGTGVLFVFATVAIWTIGEMISNPPMMTFVANRAQDANRGRYMGMFSMVLSISFVVAPLIGTWVYENFGPDVLWHGCLAVGVIDFLAFELLARRLRASGAH